MPKTGEGSASSA